VGSPEPRVWAHAGRAGYARPQAKQNPLALLRPSRQLPSENYMTLLGRTRPPGSHDSRCRGRTAAWRAARGERCTARLAPARALDALVWQDRWRSLRAPALMTHALARAPGGAWLPQALPARRQTLREALTPLERPPARRLEVALAEIIGRDACERTRPEVTHTHQGLTQPRRQLEAQAPPQVATAALAQGVEALCRRLHPPGD